MQLRQTRVGEGSPLLAAGPAATEPRRAAIGALGRIPQPAPRPLALLACRSSANRQWGTRWLERFGFEVLATGSGGRVVEMIREHAPKVVLLDVGLRDRFGTDIHLRPLTEPNAIAVPKLVLCRSEKQVRRALEAGASDVVREPLNWQLAARRASDLARAHSLELQLVEARSALETERRLSREAQRRVEDGARIDRLTGLPTWEELSGTLGSALAVTAGPDRSTKLLSLQLDRLSALYEVLGKQQSDEVVRQAGDRLAEALRRKTLLGNRASSNIVSLARSSRGEFIVMLSSRKDTTAPAEALLELMAKPFWIGHQQLWLTASIGVAVSETGDESSESLLQRAHVALEQARRQGGGVSCVYDERLRPKGEDMKMKSLLHEALERRELSVVYQPIVDTKTGNVVSAEALLRWNSPQLGHVAPVDFVPLAEECGLMVEIGEFVLRTACRRLRGWLDRGLGPIRMAVNVSSCQLARVQFADSVREILEETALDPSMLELELSERGVLHGDPGILERLLDLKELGVRIVIDDFGAGDSAMSYLRRFPIDGLKVDGSFIRGAPNNQTDAAIASAIIDIAHRLDLEVVAEGVESEEQLGMLEKWGCTCFQGFLFSTPVAAHEFEYLLTSGGKNA